MAEMNGQIISEKTAPRQDVRGAMLITDCKAKRTNWAYLKASISLSACLNWRIRASIRAICNGLFSDAR